MSDPPPNRAKRPLSPTTASFIPPTARKTSRPNHTMSSTDRATLLALDSQQKDELIKKLVDFHPTARQTISSVLPTIAPMRPAPKVKLTESLYFVHEVECCAYWLSNRSWMNHATTSREACCQAVSKAVMFELNRIKIRCIDCVKEKVPLPTGCNSLDDLCRDAIIARLDIGLLILKRRNRLSIRKWRCSSEPCQWTTDLVETFDDLEDWIDPDYDEFLDWFRYLFHEQPDNSTHPLRLTVLKLINLPSLLPPMNPNDYYDEDRADERENRVTAALGAIRLVLDGNQLPDLTSDPIPGLEDISI